MRLATETSSTAYASSADSNMGFPLEAYQPVCPAPPGNRACKIEAVSNHFGTSATLQRIKITWCWVPRRKPSRNRHLEYIRVSADWQQCPRRSTLPPHGMLFS